MPELPEVETVRRGLALSLQGRRIRNVRQMRPDLRFPFPARLAERLQGATFLRVERRAKYLLFRLDSGETLAAHLGMTGRFTVFEKGASQGKTPGRYVHATKSAHQTHEHVVFELDGGGALAYADPRRFGYMVLEATDTLPQHALFKNLGPEPLEVGFDADVLALLARDRRTDLKSFLLDQRVVVGLGNIYVNEALHRAKLKPSRNAATLARSNGTPHARTHPLVQAIKDILQSAIAAGGSTLRDFANAQGESGAFQHRFQVYGREGEPCPRTSCPGTIKRTITSGRSTFACNRCQH